MDKNDMTKHVTVTKVIIQNLFLNKQSVPVCTVEAIAVSK